jgi:dipicolinate synthase subunit A
LQIALEELPITLHNSQCLVIGFGRTGKMIASVLSGVGANVTVSARKHSDIAWIKSHGYQPVYANQLEEVLPYQDLIVNTVPHLVLDEAALKKVGDSTLIIDVASKPGGVDFTKAKELGKKFIWALSLPGKVAPLTAGEIIKSTIDHILQEMEV